MTNREGGDADATLAFLASAVVQPYAGSVRFRELSEASAGLSSTAARKASAAGDALDLVPPAVARYIREHGLYAGKDAGGG